MDHLRDFRSSAIFEFFNTIGEEETCGTGGVKAQGQGEMPKKPIKIEVVQEGDERFLLKG